MNAKLRRFEALLIAVTGGVVFALSSPPTDLYPAVVIGLAMLAYAVADAPSFWRAFGRGAAWATAAGVVGLRFVPAVIQRFTPLGPAPSYLALVLLSAAQSLAWALCAGLTALFLRRARAPFEIAFAAGTLVAVMIPSVFAWTPAGLVSPWPSFLQLADLIGERGVSVLFAVAAALLARSVLALRGRSPGSSALLPDATPAPKLSKAALYPALGAAALFAALAVHGSLRMASIARAAPGLPSVRVGLISQAVGPEERWDRANHAWILRRLRDLTKSAEARGAELTIWPEAAYPYPLEHGARRTPHDNRAVVGKGVRGPVLIGLITLARPAMVDGALEQNSYNSAAVVKPDGTLSPSYDKLELLWFGEMVPGGAYLPWLRRIFQKSGGLIPGTEPRSLTLDRGASPAVRAGVLNCYEDTLAGVGRRIALSLRPNLLVNVTNDAWFTGTAEPELHARLAVMRAIELRLDLVRAVNRGVASWVDATGEVRSRDERSEPFVMMAEPRLRDAPLTFYARRGDAPLWVLLSWGLLFFERRASRSRRALSRSAGVVSPDP
ncbi:MAG TPA: apolipoprotein N-acyltransferase [Polyangiaceae bacterium]|jgi:apolipoprotein N-acyltransferase|nr:apolipoprotein N-acyltransferase [Polyangiaceae bacterium]